MTSIYPYLYACPDCSTIFKHISIPKKLNFGRKEYPFFTDGYVDDNLIPHYPVLICSDCGRMFWENEAVSKGPLDEREGFTDKYSFLASVSFQEVYDKEYWHNEQDEKYIRIQFWHESNMKARYLKDQEFDLSQMQIENLKRLVQILDEMESDELLMKAEAFRNLGKFADCLNLLEAFNDIQHEKAANKIRELAEKGIRRVKSVN